MKIVTGKIDLALEHVMREQQAASTIYARVVILRLSMLPQKKDHLYTRILPTMLSLFGDPEGKIMHYPDDDVVIVSRVATLKNYQIFCDVLKKDLPDDVDISVLCRLHELPTDSLYLEAFLKEKADQSNDVQKPSITKSEKSQVSFQEPILSLSMIKSIPVRRRDRNEQIIQIIEDDAFSQRIISNILREKCVVVNSSTGRDALHHYSLHAPDIVFLDIGLPDINGQDLLKRLLDIDPTAFVVMLSGQGNKENVLNAIQKGAKGFIGKPFSNQKLVQFIRSSPFIQQKRKHLGEFHV